MEIDFLNRRVNLYDLKQTLTYEGLLEGLPTSEGNQRRLKSLVGKERDEARYGVEPYLVPPTETPIEYKGNRPYPFGTPARLPSVLCIARFESFAPASNKKGDGSGLKVIWLQERFALPIAEQVLHHLRKTDWCRYAGSFEY